MYWYIFLSYAEVLAWPIVAVIGILLLRDLPGELLKSAVPGSRFSISVSGVEFGITIRQLEKSINESLRNRKLTVFQWQTLKTLRDKGRQPYDGGEYKSIRPLRNAGLILEHPEGTLSECKEIEITPLGELLVDAKYKSE